MRSTKFAPLVFLTLLSLSDQNNINSILISQNQTIGPSDPYSDNFNLSITYLGNSLSNYRELFQIKNLEETSIYYSSNGKNRSIVNGQITTNFNVPMKSYFKIAGVKMSLKITYTVDGSFVFYKMLDIYPRSKDTINTLLYQDKDYQSPNLIIDFTSDKNRFEKYIFSSLAHTVFNNSYSIMPLTHLSFKYIFPLSFSYSEAYLTTSDPKGIFKDLVDTATNQVKVPLKLKQQGENITFSYLFNYYVHPKTLIMSNTYKVGYVTTNKFYLPVNMKENLKDYPFEIHIINAGANQNHIIIPLTYQNHVELLDNCISSDFCLSGGIKK